MPDDPRKVPIRWRRGKQLIETVPGPGAGEEASIQRPDSTGHISLKQLADLATACWRVRKRALKAAQSTGESPRIIRELDAMLESFQAIGVEIKDYTDETFDYGLPLKVITTQPVAGLLKEKVSETIKPTVFWKENLIQIGEVIIETPVEAE